MQTTTETVGRVILPANSLFSITVKRKNKLWVFSDDRFGLVDEPFVKSATAVIDNVKRKKNIRRRTLNIVFSTTPMPNTDLTLALIEKHKEVRVYKGKNGKYYIYVPHDAQYVSGTYTVIETGEQLWLCPAQLHYFGNVANIIFATIN